MNTMNEELLTRYVAGELTAEEHEEVRAALETDEAAREMVAELEATVAVLTEAFNAEALLELDAWGRKEITDQAQLAHAFPATKGEDNLFGNVHRIEGGLEKRRRHVPWFGIIGTLAAACVLAAILLPSLGRAREAARAWSPENERKQWEVAAKINQQENLEKTDPGYLLGLRQEAERRGMADEFDARLGTSKDKLEANVARVEAAKTEMAQTSSIPAASAPASPPPPPAEVAQLQSLGYGSADAAAKPESQNFYSERDVLDWRARRPPVPFYDTPGEAYNPITENPFKLVTQEPLSTFSIDVDTGSYSNVRRFLESGSRPPADAVRIEELINYFDYSYAPPAADAPDPFAAHVAVAACPWNPAHKLVRVALKGKEFPAESRVNSNLVFLVDVSGSMNEPTKLPLVQQGLRMLVNQLGENDRVSIVVYAGSSGLVLPPTNGSNKAEILGALDRLSAGGSTNGGEGIQLAYKLAREAFIPGGVNRVVLASDGDFNVGVTSQEELIRLIESEAKSKVFLTVLGFGTGNLKDGTMEQLANKGNGMYAYIDSAREAKKVFVDQVQGSLVTIAKDVKIQIEFNPAKVQSYRLIGYENRALAAQDFNDDTKDAGEIGAGHTVTALYEVAPVGSAPQPGVDPLKYQAEAPKPEPSVNTSDELMTLKLRYKQPEGDVSKLMETPVMDSTQDFAQADEDFRFAASVAAFGMLLRGSQHAGSATMEQVQTWAAGAMGKDTQGYRAEFLDLVRKAQQ